jgi:hypothetical protein
MKYEVSYIKRTRVLAHVEAESKEDAFYKVDFSAHQTINDGEVSLLGPVKVKIKELA